MIVGLAKSIADEVQYYATTKRIVRQILDPHSHPIHLRASI